MTILHLTLAMSASVKCSPIESSTAKSASAAVRKARTLSSRMTAQQFIELLREADKLSYAKFKFEARTIAQILSKTKYVNADCYCVLATTYTDVLGDEDPTKPAEKYLKLALEIDPKYSKAYALLADYANQEGRFSDAVAYCNKATACPVIDPMVYQCKASALANLNRLPEALAAINRGIDCVHNRAELHRIKGSILENMHRHSEALESFRQADRIEPNEWNCYQIVHVLEIQNKLAEAITEISKVIANNPKDGEAYRTRAQLKIKSKDLSGALKDYDTTIELEPTAKTLKDRANLHLQMGHKELYMRDSVAAKKLIDSPF
ncbi:MAG: tetratricopeptide repeat protein [Candidatus Obscuribacterales bacterium]